MNATIGLREPEAREDVEDASTIPQDGASGLGAHASCVLQLMAQTEHAGRVRPQGVAGAVLCPHIYELIGKQGRRPAERNREDRQDR
jgi:hypothetical protein